VPAVPEKSNEDGLVPPLKVLRRRVNGVYRADGLAGPTRRYVLIVALLVGLASLPTLAAITAGKDELDDGSTGAMDVPFLPPPSAGPVIPALPKPSSPRPSTPGTVSPGEMRGQAGERKPRAASSGNRRRSGSGRSPAASVPARASSGSGTSGSSGSRRLEDHDTSSGLSKTDEWKPGGSKPGGSKPGGSKPAGPKPAGSKPGGPDSPGEGDAPPEKPVTLPPVKPTEPTDPDDLPPPHERPACHERGECGSRESWHHRPDWSRHRRCEDSTRRAHWSHHRESGTDQVVTNASRHVHEDDTVESRPSSPPLMSRTVVSPRRSTMIERAPNVRPTRSPERTHNSRRYHADNTRWDEIPAQSRAYRGSHRADHLHRADEDHTGARDRSSRVGRHHADHQQDHTNRW
jgi:hypothetical protein